MKKIVSLVAAAALALGLAGCSGDLHDEVAGTPVELSEEFNLTGSFTDPAWADSAATGAIPLAKGDGDYIWTASFTANDATAQFSITKDGWVDQKGGNDIRGGTFPEGVAYDAADNGMGGINAVLSGLTSGTYYTMTIDCSAGIVISLTASGGSAPAAPVPFMLDGFYLVGCPAIGLGNFTPSPDGLIWGAEVNKASGEVTYIKDFAYTPCGDTWHSGAEAVLKLSTNDWKKNYGATPLEVDADFVELTLVSDGGNADVSGLKEGGAYRLTIKTTPEEAVFAKVEEIAAYTLSFKVVGGTEGTEYFIDGTPWGASWKNSWPIKGWGGSYATAKKDYPECFATADESGVAQFEAEKKFVGLPGGEDSYEVKLVSITPDGDGTLVAETSNISFTVEVEKKDFVISIDFDEQEAVVE